MQIGLSGLCRGGEGKREITVRYDGKQIRVAGSSYPVTEAKDAVFLVEQVSKGKYLLEGDYGITAMGSCDRCLKDVPVSLEVSVSETFDTDEEDTVDVDELLDREFLMKWPAKVLCREDCKGLCMRCGADLNEGECSCKEEQDNDSIWARAFEQIKV